MKYFLILSLVILFSSLSAQNSEQFNSIVFGSQNFTYYTEKNEVFLRDRDTTWGKLKTKSTYAGETKVGDKVLRKQISFNYPSKNELRSTLIIEGRPAKLKSVVIKDGKIKSIYKCEVDLAAGVFSPSGLKSFRCYFVTPKICNEMKKSFEDVVAYNSIDIKDPLRENVQAFTQGFFLSLVSSLDTEKNELLTNYEKVFKFLLNTDAMNEDDLKLSNYRDSYRTLCMGLRREQGSKLRFKYGLDKEYELNVCPDHGHMMLETKKFRETYLATCESLTN